jgi:hypothetical protein
MTLLNDDEFAELAEAAHRKAGAPRDELAKQRVWNNLESHTAESPVRRKRLIGFVGLALAAALAAVVVRFDLLESGREKGVPTAQLAGEFLLVDPMSGEIILKISGGETLNLDRALVPQWIPEAAGDYALMLNTNVIGTCKTCAPERQNDFLDKSGKKVVLNAVSGLLCVVGDDRQSLCATAEPL